MSMITKNVIIGLIITITLIPMMNEIEIQTLCDLGHYEYCEPELVWATQNQTSFGSCPNQTSARDLMARSWCDFEWRNSVSNTTHDADNANGS